MEVFCKMNKTIKKIVALGAVAAMVGVTAAHAATLADYPEPFVDNGQFMGKIVLGEKAQVIDTIGATDIAASLQRAASMKASSTGGTVVTSSSGKVEDVLIGTELSDATAFGSTLDDTDLPFLADSTVTFDINGDSEDYDYHEEIRFDTGASVETGLTFASNPGEDWKDRVFIPVAPNSVGYYYVFDETLQNNLQFANATTDDPVTLEFLGKKLKITGATATSITAQVGNDYFMTVGETVTVDGKSVKLANVASSGNTAVVEVDGVRETVSGTETVNGLRIKVDDTFYSDTLSERSATLVIGTDATKTYATGDEYIGEDKDNPAWVWDISGLTGATPTLGVTFALNLDDINEDDNPAYEHPLYQGESLEFPNNFAEVKFDSLNQNDYVTYEFKEDTRDLYASSSATSPAFSSAKVIKATVSGLSNSGFLIGSQKADTIYLYANDSDNIAVYYKDTGSTSHAIFSGYATDGDTPFKLDYGKSTVDVNMAGTADDGNLTFDFDGSGGDDLVLALKTSGSNAYTYVGNAEDDTNTGLYYLGVGSIANWEENTRTATGVVITDPDATFKKTSGSLKFQLPKDVTDFRANVVVQGAGGSTSSSGGSTGAVTLNPIAVGLAILDSEATLGSKPYIVVGGPCVNTVAATLMGNPAVCTTGFSEGKAMIKLYSDKNALLVAGYSGKDTQGASRVLSYYMDYSDKFMGTELEVITTTLSDLKVNNVQ
jgi:hypothetical protein